MKDLWPNQGAAANRRWNNGYAAPLRGCCPAGPSAGAGFLSPLPEWLKCQRSLQPAGRFLRQSLSLVVRRRDARFPALSELT